MEEPFEFVVHPVGELSMRGYLSLRNYVSDTPVDRHKIQTDGRRSSIFFPQTEFHKISISDRPEWINETIFMQLW